MRTAFAKSSCFVMKGLFIRFELSLMPHYGFSFLMREITMKVRATYSTPTSWGYRGSKHRYTIHHRGTAKAWASFQISRKWADACIKRFFGYTQSFSLPGLEILQSGFGWYRVYLKNKANPDLIVALFRMINHVLLKEHQPTAVRVRTRKRYCVHNKPVSRVTLAKLALIDVLRMCVTTPVHAVTPNRLQQLAAVVNARYGH